MKACLEVGEGSTGAFIPDLPGCWVFARSEERVLAKAKSAASRWYAWARRHGEPVAPPTRIRVEPSEVLRVNYNPIEAGKPEPLFWSEVLPVTTQDVVRTLRLMNHSRRDLLELVNGLDGDALRRRPRGRPRTIGDCLRHIAIVEWWYITRLDIDLPADFPRNRIELLHYTRGLAERELKRLTKDQRTLIFQLRNDPSPVCNLWTARKVLRRLVDHERLHTAYIEKALAETRPRRSLKTVRSSP